MQPVRLFGVDISRDNECARQLMNYVDRVRNICGSMLVIAILGGAIAASAETEYPVLRRAAHVCE